MGRPSLGGTNLEPPENNTPTINELGLDTPGGLMGFHWKAAEKNVGARAEGVGKRGTKLEPRSDATPTINERGLETRLATHGPPLEGGGKERRRGSRRDKGKLTRYQIGTA